tara:strand:- start:1058 stop:1237 length:180 start_codon:yes stop_codon:yes gene_type:complete
MDNKLLLKYANFQSKYHNDPEFRKKHIARVRASKLKKQTLSNEQDKIKFVRREITVVFT